MIITANIGRELSKPTEFDVNVPKDYDKVSRKHLTVRWQGADDGKDGILTIEDHDTPNGTFVNNRRYAKKKLEETDVVHLGGKTKDDYQLDVKALFAAFKQAELKQRTDFSEEFKDIKAVAIKYYDEKQKILKLKGWNQRLVMYGVPTIVTTVLGLFVTNNKFYNMLFMVLGFLVGMFVDMAFGKDERGKIEDLKLKYQPKYRCPKCGYRFNLEAHHWKQLEAEGCPNPKGCDAKFGKP